MNVDILLPIFSAVLAAISAFLGVEMANNPPAKDERRLKWIYRSVFILVAALLVASTIWQTTRNERIKADARLQEQRLEGKLDTIAGFVSHPPPSFDIKQVAAAVRAMTAVRTVAASRIEPGSPSEFGEVTNERLNEIAKSNVNDLREWENRWHGQEFDMDTMIFDAGRPDPYSGVTDQERAATVKGLERNRAELRDTVLKSQEAKVLISTTCNLQTQLLNRLRSWNVSWPPDTHSELLFDKLKRGNYKRNDLQEVITYMQGLQQRFADVSKLHLNK